MGGSSGSSPSPSSAPAPAAPIDYAAITKAGQEGAASSYKSQLADQLAAYPKMASQQLGTISTLADNLNDGYTKEAKGILDTTLQQGVGSLAATGNRLNDLGNTSAGLANAAASQAGADLALGRELSPEQIRNSQQAADAGFNVRGMATGSQAADAEILNRSAYGDARYQQRLGNASAAQGMLGNAGNLYGQAGGAYQSAAQLGFGGANALLNLDPYQRALGMGVQLGSGIQGQTGQMIGNAYNQGLDMSGNAATFNANMLDTRYNSYLNNNAALGAAKTSSNGALLGAGIGAAGMIGGAAIIF